jgi:hypothetical protein
MPQAARAAYEVRVIDTAPGENARSWFWGGLIALVAGGPDGPLPRPRVEIVATNTEVPLIGWTILPDELPLLKAKIEGDLDQLDAETFASEWGLT